MTTRSCESIRSSPELHEPNLGLIIEGRIRSLLTEDLKRRRVSGRHQISPDGIHLVDGVPFGRRRAPRDRPVLSLPPRKRARITYNLDEEEDADHDDEQPDQLLLEGPPSSMNVLDPSAEFLNNTSDDEDEDQDYMLGVGSEDEVNSVQDKDEPDDEESSGEADGLEEEIRLLQADNDVIGDPESDEDIASNEGNHEGPAQNIVAGSFSQSPQPSVPEIAPIAIAALRSAFPLTSAATIESTLLQNQTDIRRSYYELATENDPTLSFDEVLGNFLTARFQAGPPPASPTLLPQPRNAPARPLIQEVEVEEPMVTVTNGSTNTVANGNDAEKNHVDETSDDTSGSEDSSELDNESVSDSESSDDDHNDGDDDDDSSSGSSGSDSSDSSDNEDQQQPEHGVDRQQSPHEAINSSEDDSSDSDDDSESGSDSSQSYGGVSVNGATKAQTAQDSDSSSDTSSDDSSSSSEESTDMGEDSDSVSAPEEAPARPAESQRRPPQPQKNTQTSHPELVANLSASTPQELTVGRGQGLSKTQKRNARRREAKRLRNLEETRTSEPCESHDPTHSEKDLIARKQALLSAVAEGSTEPAQWKEGQDGAVTEEPQTNVNTTSLSTPNGTGALVPNEQDMNQIPDPESATSTNDETARRRMRVDMGAGRRLLFGALGLQNPKSKTDEDKIKENLMKDVRPLKNHRLDKPTEVHEDTAMVESGSDMEDWRDKITYTAVECCQEGIVLSEPPFPFVQRWDPQQQYSSIRKRKRNSQNFHQDNYYDDDSYWCDDADNETVTATESKKSKKTKNRLQASQEQAASNNQDDNIELNYDDIPANISGDVNSQFTDPDDLPSLPADVSVLPTLQVDEIKSGMVITWKQFQLSKATNWQPELRSVTGLVISMNDEKVLHLILAKRDREHNEKVYDEETGQRIYDKFEVPDDSEDDEEEEDSGFRDLPWGDLIEPRVVQGEPTLSVPNSPLAKEDAQTGMVKPGAPEGGMESRSPMLQNFPTSSMNGLDSMQVRAGIEKELMDMATTEEECAPESGPIPSGQNYTHLTISAPSVEGPSNSESSRAEISQGQSVDSAGGVIKDSQSAGRQECGGSGNTDGGGSNVNWAPKVSEVESVVGATGEDAAQELPFVDITFPSPELGSEKQQTPVVDYPRLAAPSSASSIRSGRQPQYDDGVMDYINTTADAVFDANPSEHGMGSKPEPGDVSPEGDPPLRSSSPFPTLDELWHTAQTSKQTQSPPKSSKMSALGPRKSKADTEYEEAMRQLDEGEDSDASPDRNKFIRSLFPNAIQPSPVVKLPQLSDSEEPASRPVRRSQRRSSSFQVPEGTQVIELSSSPSSSIPPEDYAEDSLDETYEDEGLSLPNGSGWVKKNKNRKSEARTVKKEPPRKPGKSLPAATTGMRPNNKSLPPPSSAGVVGQGSGRRRSSKKF